jgi:flavin reductase (DIM6/NTAB) family NADH-FMN oxidoreductase RutF
MRTVLESRPDRRHDPANAIDALAFRETLGLYASGITVVSGMTDDGPVGFTCQSFYSVSVDPPLISFSVMRTSTSYPPIRDTGRFAVNVLSHHQHEVSNQFARSGTDKWSGIDWTPTGAGNPVIDGSLMWVDCELEREVEAGDHLIVIGHVLEMSPLPATETAQAPLLYYRGRYRHLRDLV